MSTKGLHSNELLIIDYNDLWPQEFEAESIRLRLISEMCSQPWEHIGSTAVPGLSAKPIIDMMMAVHEEKVQTISEALSDLGYSKGGYLYSKTDFLLFAHPQPVTHIIHLIHEGSQEYQDKIDFRDYLRADGSVRKSYQELKLKVSRRLGDNRKDYGRYKGHFINSKLMELRKKRSQ